MFLVHEQDITERYFFFSQGSNGAGKNEFVSQYTCLQSHFSVKYENENKIITARRILT